jgi:UDP:flavonoid glycosyltransferase YjiC (YdhE family)
VGARQDSQPVLSTGSHLGVNDFRRVAPDMILVERGPQIDVLKRAALMITHGGLNSV